MFFSKSQIVQKWKCEVIRVDNECVTCVLHDLADVSKPDEIAEIYLCEFSKKHRKSLKEGSSFYWIISQETNLIGRLRSISEFTCKNVI